MIKHLRSLLSPEPTQVLSNPRNRCTPRILGWLGGSHLADVGQAMRCSNPAFNFGTGKGEHNLNDGKNPQQNKMYLPYQNKNFNTIVWGTDGLNPGSGTHLVLVVFRGPAWETLLVTAAKKFSWHTLESLTGRFCLAEL